MNSRDVRCHLFINIYIYIPVYPGAGDCIYLKKTCTKKQTLSFCDAAMGIRSWPNCVLHHMSYQCIACRVFLHWDILWFGNSHRCDARRARGGCQLWAATLQLRCPDNRVSAPWISQYIYIYIWILEHISHPEWNWNFELSWTTALASCRCSFRFWQLEDEALRKNMCIERNCCTCCGIKQGWELAMQQATHKNCTLTVTALFQVGRNTIRSSKNLRPEYNI